MALPANVTTGIWTLDTSHSEIGFTVRHAGISKVRGQFKEATATLDLAENVADSKINATIQTASFDSGDVNRDARIDGVERCVRYHIPGAFGAKCGSFARSGFPSAVRLPEMTQLLLAARSSA